METWFKRAACIVEQSPDPLLLGKRSSAHPIPMQGKASHLNARSHRVCAAKLVVWFMLNDSSCESWAYRETQPENTCRAAVELWRPDGNGFTEDIFNRPARFFCHVTLLHIYFRFPTVFPKDCSSKNGKSPVWQCGLYLAKTCHVCAMSFTKWNS